MKKVNPYILFDENEVKEVQKSLFSEKPRLRDFQNDNDKIIFKNLPKWFGI